MAETGQPAPHGSDDGFYTCERCGKVKAVASACTATRARAGRWSRRAGTRR